MSATPKVGELGFMIFQTDRGMDHRDVTVTEVSPDEATVTIRYPLSSNSLGTTGFGTLKLCRQKNSDTWYKVGNSSDSYLANEYVMFGSVADNERRRFE